VKLKNGPISTKEKEFIQANGALGVQAIADRLGRSPTFVKKHLREAAPPAAAAATALRDTAAWKRLKDQLTAPELVYFEEQYQGWMEQIGEDDVLASERTQVIKVIMYEVMLDRTLRQSKRVAVDIEAAELGIEKCRKQIASPTNGEEVTKAKGELPSLLDMRDGLYTQKERLSVEHAKLDEKHQKLMEALKATRDQRLSKVESRRSFLDLIKSLQNDEIRKRAEFEMDQMNRAARKELQRLAAPHQFADGQFDRPILNADTVMMEGEAHD